MRVVSAKRALEVADAIKQVETSQAEEFHVRVPDTDALAEVDKLIDEKFPEGFGALSQAPFELHLHFNNTSAARLALNELHTYTQLKPIGSADIQPARQPDVSTVSVEGGVVGGAVSGALLGGVGGTVAGALLPGLRSAASTNPFLGMVYFVVGGIALGTATGALTGALRPKLVWIDVTEDHARVGVGTPPFKALYQDDINKT